MTGFFYDSYAVIEYINNNPRFYPYFEQHTGVLSIFNVVEIYYSVLTQLGTEKAALIFETLYPLIIEPSKETIKKAMLFREQMKKQKVSYADSIGYQLALERGIPFLTGDKEFKGLKNVEFVK